MIVYFSNVSHYTHTFVEKLDEPPVRIPLKTKEAKEFTVDEDFVLVFPTYGASGKNYVPPQVIQFLNQKMNRQHLRGIVATGNRNFLEDFARGGDIVAAKCGVPVLYRMELSGTQEDVTIVNEGLKKFWETELQTSHTLS